MSRNMRIGIRLSEEEYEQVIKKANKVGISLSSFVRKAILGVELKEKPPNEFYKLINELGYISNNINQIAVVANRYHFIDELRYKQNEKKINDFILQVRKKYLEVN